VAERVRDPRDARRGIGGYVDRYHLGPHSRLGYTTPYEAKQTWEDHQNIAALPVNSGAEYVRAHLAWLHNFKRLLVPLRTPRDIHHALLALGCRLVCFRRLRIST